MMPVLAGSLRAARQQGLQLFSTAATAGKPLSKLPVITDRTDLRSNLVFLVGKVMTDPSSKASRGGQMAFLTLAQFPNRRGQARSQDEPPQFFKLLAFNKVAEDIMREVRKGHLIQVEGRLSNKQTRREDTDVAAGEDRYADEVRVIVRHLALVDLPRAGDGEGRGRQQQADGGVATGGRQ